MKFKLFVSRCPGCGREEVPGWVIAIVTITHNK